MLYQFDLDPSASDQFFTLVAQNVEFLIFMMSLAFLYASLGRAKIFHHNTPARAIFAVTVSLLTAGTIYASHWDSMQTILAWAIAGGIISLIVLAVVMHRGKLKHEQERQWQREEKRDRINW
jgi:hypothetical protein